MQLYSGPLSLFTAKVRVALDEKGLSYERVEVGWSRERRYLPHHPDVVALNPKREVPVLVDADLVVYDSTLILEYLEDRYPEPALYPAAPAARARCRQLEAAADEILFPQVWSLIEEVFYPADAAVRDEDRLRAAMRELGGLYDDLEKELSGRAYLCDEFSVADIGTYIMTNAAATLGAAPSEAHPQLRAWLARVGERAAVRREVEAMQASVVSAMASA